MQTKKTLVIGLTGGIGSGKTTVANLFANLYVPIIDADMIAREVTQVNSSALTAITQHFQENLLLADGSLNRSKLRQIIFAHPEERHWLENLLHPLIQTEIEKRIQTISAPYCIVVIPLLFEVQPYSFIDRVLVVDAPEHLQIERVMTRDKAEKNHVETIMQSQVQREHRLAKADDIIINTGSIEDLEKEVENLHNQYLAYSR